MLPVLALAHAQQEEGGPLELFSVYVPTNHIYVGDIFLLGREDVIHTNLSVREGLGARASPAGGCFTCPAEFWLLHGAYMQGPGCTCMRCPRAAVLLRTCLHAPGCRMMHACARSYCAGPWRDEMGMTLGWYGSGSWVDRGFFPGCCRDRGVCGHGAAAHPAGLQQALTAAWSLAERLIRREGAQPWGCGEVARAVWC